MSLPVGYVLLVAYWTVLVAELVGDKAIYTVASLSLRFPRRTVFAGIAVAFALKMLVAVLLGSAVARFESPWTNVISAIAFFISAMLIWFDEPVATSSEPVARVHWLRAAAVSFASLFFTEWGDPGQISAAALTVKSHAAMAVWLGGTLAMLTKGAVAMMIGVKLRERLPHRMLRTLASASCCLLGVLALVGVVAR